MLTLPNMKYLVRSLKYFVYLTIILVLIILILVKLRLANSDLSEMFVNGYDSLWQIALIIAAFSAVYPKFGFSSRNARLAGSDAEIRPGVTEVMEDHGYRLEKEEEGKMSFIKRAPLSRALKMWEDRITLIRTIDGYSVEGLTKDIVRIISALEYRYRNTESDQ